MEFSNFNKQAKSTSYRHGNLYEVGSYVQNTDGEVGKIHRRGPNYVIAVTEEGDMFRSWVNDIKEYKQWNTSGADQTHRLVGTNKFRKFTERMTPGHDYDMWKKPTEVNRRINKTKPIKEETMSANVRLSAWMLGLSLAEQQEIASKMDKIILSGDVIEGILESFGTEKMQDLAVEYASIVSGEELAEGMKQARANVGASKCWDGYKAQGTKKKGGKEVPNCVKEDEETVSEHHQKDKDGNTIPHEEELEEGKKGLYANIHAKRARGEKMRSKGDKGAPTDKAFRDSEKTAKKEEVEYVEEKKKLDPVGKEDGDVDNDGDKDSSDSYLMKRRAAVSAAIKAKKGTKKEGFSDWRSELIEKDVKGVIVNPDIDDATDPMSVFDKNKKLKGANKAVKEECGSDKDDDGSEKALAKKATKVKRVKYQDGVTESVNKALREHAEELKALYL
tara:strand:+ start:699 stop:2039 length:1341 start_codon:yes stop_codon:yes gene_type:complete